MLSVINDFFIYILLLVLSILNIVVPISGSSVVTPLLAILTDPHKAIGLASFYFMMSSFVRVFLFRHNINWREINNLLPISLLAAFFGALSLVAINSLVMYLIIFIFTVYFLAKKLRSVLNIQANTKQNKEKRMLSWTVGALSGFLQGAGLAGSDLRNSYLLGRGLSLPELHATTALVGASNFLLATIVRLFTEQLTFPDLKPLIYIFPFILAGILLGRKILFKLSKKTANIIVITVMVSIVVMLGYKILLVVFGNA